MQKELDQFAPNFLNCFSTLKRFSFLNMRVVGKSSLPHFCKNLTALHSKTDPAWTISIERTAAFGKTNILCKLLLNKFPSTEYYKLSLNETVQMSLHINKIRHIIDDKTICKLRAYAIGL